MNVDYKELIDVDCEKKILFPCDENGREIFYYKLKKICFLSNHTFYPDVLIKHNNEVFNPVQENVMSLMTIKKNKTPITDTPQIKFIETGNFFYFIYNTDNYFHFVYDTLPYLITYLELKQKKRDLKLLVNYPNFQKKTFYPFFTEFLSLLSISEKDIILVSENTSYENLYVSSSYTHGINSNLPPRNEIYDFYQKIVSRVDLNDETKYPKKIYISRRTWINKDLSNIGTNYTTKRMCLNENELVNFLTKNGYSEVFTENLPISEKIKLFQNAEFVIGAIGGGVCNVLFSKKNTKLMTIVSPTFLEINNRFTFSLSKVRTDYFFGCNHSIDSPWKPFMRVQTDSGFLGEIEEILDDELVVSYTEKKLSGWNSELNLKTTTVKKENCIPLDSGLNSPYIVDLNQFEKVVRLWQE